MTTEPVEEGSEKWCPVVAASRALSSVWSIVAIYYLVDGPKGFNELLRSIPGMNSKTLSRTLKSLQSKGLVLREVVSLQPFSVRYRLTPMGEELVPVLNALKEWGEKWMRPGTAQDGARIPAVEGDVGLKYNIRSAELRGRAGPWAKEEMRSSPRNSSRSTGTGSGP